MSTAVQQVKAFIDYQFMNLFYLRSPQCIPGLVRDEFPNDLVCLSGSLSEDQLWLLPQSEVDRAGSGIKLYCQNMSGVDQNTSRVSRCGHGIRIVVFLLS